MQPFRRRYDHRCPLRWLSDPRRTLRAMIKLVPDDIWCFDAEWAPDPISGRAAYDLPADMPVLAIFEEMWKKGGATPEEPRPYLKTVLCRVLSISAVVRRSKGGREVSLMINSLPGKGDEHLDEAEILDRFLGALGKSRPQLVGFNSLNADLPIFTQRALVHGLQAAGYCERPNKPWEGKDYFQRGSDWNVDLKDVLGAFGRANPTLHEVATACGIPGKMDVSGANVTDLWLNGEIRRIVQYNECDAVTTYLLWLRTAHFAGFVSDTGYAAEQQLMRELLEKRGAEPGNEHLLAYLEKWDALRALRTPAR